jgi:hypothetical protein
VAVVVAVTIAKDGGYVTAKRNADKTTTTTATTITAKRRTRDRLVFVRAFLVGLRRRRRCRPVVDTDDDEIAVEIAAVVAVEGTVVMCIYRCILLCVVVVKLETKRESDGVVTVLWRRWMDILLDLVLRRAVVPCGLCGRRVTREKRREKIAQHHHVVRKRERERETKVPLIRTRTLEFRS